MTMAATSATAAKPSFGFGDLSDIRPAGTPEAGHEEPPAEPVGSTVRPGDGRSDGDPGEGARTVAKLDRSSERRPPAASRGGAGARSSSDALREADRAAERLGFQSREASPVRRRRRQPVEEAVDQFNLRAAVTDLNRFIEWCEDERQSYREGFAILVRLIPPGRRR